MDAVGVLVAVQILMGTLEPEVLVVPLDMLPLSECRSEERWHRDNPSPTRVTQSGKVLFFDRTICLSFSETEFQKVATAIESRKESERMFALPLEERVDRPAE